MKNKTLIFIIGGIIGLCAMVGLCIGFCAIYESFRYIKGKGDIVYRTPHLDIDAGYLLIGVLIIILVSTIIFYLIKTKFGINSQLDDEITNVEYEIKRNKLLIENNRLKEELQKLCAK